MDALQVETTRLPIFVPLQHAQHLRRIPAYRIVNGVAPGWAYQVRWAMEVSGGLAARFGVTAGGDGPSPPWPRSINQNGWGQPAS